jgi:hypothetical protein
MSPPSPELALRISDPSPYGDVTIAPAAMTGRSEAQLARAMAEVLLETAPQTDADALRQLRETFPSSPLTVRVAALAAIMRR